MRSRMQALENADDTAANNKNRACALLELARLCHFPRSRGRAPAVELLESGASHVTILEDDAELPAVTGPKAAASQLVLASPQ